MKLFIATLTALSLASCGSQKAVTGSKEVEKSVEVVETAAEDIQENVEEMDTTASQTRIGDNYRIVGVIHVNDDPCGAYIEAQEKDGMVKMYPVNLEDKYKKDGLRVKFDYTLSRAMQPAGCSVDKVIAVRDFTVLR